MRSVMSHKFSEVPKAEIPRSAFDRSFGYKTTFDSGLLIPFLVDEALPGDTFNINLTGFARLATPIFPLMDNMFMDTQFFAVPNRLLWENWERFMGAQDGPNDSVDFLIPEIAPLTATEQSIYDYMGIPPAVPDLSVSALPLRAYNLIWNEWYRDENLQNSVTKNIDDGPDPTTDYNLLRRGKRHDYFTSCLPWPQKGDSVDLPLGTTAPIVSDTLIGGTGIPTLDPSPNLTGAYLSIDSGTAQNTQWSGSGGGLAQPANWNTTSLVADLTNATAATINSLRQAFQIQRMAERDARGGTRYTEIVRSHFGVTSPDARLQRPEYLGGGSTPIIVSPIAQTSASGSDVFVSDTPQGNLAAVGTASLNGHGFTKSFTEHCTIIGVISVRADLTYQQGLDRMWSRRTKFDYYWPALSHIGEQAVLNQEIYAQGSADAAADAAIFGYQERFAEYRYKNSLITGKLRSSSALSLDAWHLSQDFSSLPVLGANFIQETPPVDRVVAVPSEPDFIFDSYIQYRCARPMPIYGVPGYIDHF